MTADWLKESYCQSASRTVTAPSAEDHVIFDHVAATERLTGHLHEIYLLRCDDDSIAILKKLPSSAKPCMTLEKDAITNEIIIHALLRAENLPLPQVIACEGFRSSRTTFLVTEYVGGTSYESLHTKLTRSAKNTVRRQIKAFEDALKSHRSPTFGPATEVRYGRGYRTWDQAFRQIFESILADGEDRLVGLPYTEIREQLKRLVPELGEVKEATLVLPGLRDPRNILLDRSTARVMAVLDLGWLAVWGDAELMEPPSDMSEKTLLYICFHATMTIVRYHCRPRSSHEDCHLNAWRSLHESLAALRV